MLFQAPYAPGVLRLLTADRRIRSASCGSQISSEISSGDGTLGCAEYLLAGLGSCCQDPPNIAQNLSESLLSRALAA